MHLPAKIRITFLFKGSAFSAYASQFFQNGVPPFYEQIPSLRRPLLYLDSSIDQMVRIYIYCVLVGILDIVSISHWISHFYLIQNIGLKLYRPFLHDVTCTRHLEKKIQMM